MLVAMADKVLNLGRDVLLNVELKFFGSVLSVPV
jgi:hypothetical protein